MDLTDAQWERVAPLIPNPPRRKDGRGRPRRERREVLAGVLWILRTGAQWAELPRRYPPYQTCHRYFQQWCQDGTLKGLLHALAQDPYERGGIDISEAFHNGTFAGAKKGNLLSGRRSAGRGPRSWRLQTAPVFLSPPGLPVLRRMRSRSWTIRLRTASSIMPPTG